jgi:competence protein ComEC
LKILKLKGLKNFHIPIWKPSPFIRILVPFIVGILIQYYNPLGFMVIVTAAIIVSLLFFVFLFTSLSFKFKYQWLQGLIINLLICLAGILLTFQKEIKNNTKWFGNLYTDSCALVLKITEPLAEKDNSFKTMASVSAINKNGKTENYVGNVLIYFSKEDSVAMPKYGDYILIKGGLQKIRNAGNPGGFNYSRYMGFQETYHQAYLKPNDFVLLKNNDANFLYNFIFAARKKVVEVLKENIPNDKKVTGIAEALLIGYKEDLDKDLVQAYSNTGVVHIIAISGMHLGLIYVVLVWLFARTPIIKKSKLAQVILIIVSLWLFSLITGASASVLRSAVMFTCIVIGKTFFKQSVIYNSLASSAFLLLAYNPFMLWDVGFQLSYTAVVGIVWLKKPIENLYYSRHKFVRQVWSMCAITLAAQVLTLPLCIYYFHQIPTLFLFTNLVCVPLSTIILFAEILLIIIAPIKALAAVVGKCIYFLTWLMNTIIEFFNGLPGSLIDKVHANAFTTLALYAFAILLSYSLLQKNKKVFKVSLVSLLVFTGVWTWGKIKLYNQQKMIVYNVPKHRAVDFITNNKYYFFGDAEMMVDGALQNFNLKPSRVLYQMSPAKDSLQKVEGQYSLCNFKNKKIIFIDKPVAFAENENAIQLDAIVISKNPKIKITEITKSIKPNIVVLDGSNSLWKITQWKKDCEELHLPYFITGEQGAFVLDAE